MKYFKSPGRSLVSTFLLFLSLAPILLAGPLTLPVFGGEPAGDAIMVLDCVGLLPSTPDCVNESLRTFENLVYDSNENGLYDLGERLLGPPPSLGAALSDDPRIRYRDSTTTGTTREESEPIFVDQDGDPATTGDRVFLLGSPTSLTTNIRDDPRIMFVDQNGNGQLEGLVMVTARLEQVGGTNVDGSAEDVDGIQLVFTFNRDVLQVMRISYPTGSVLPDRSQYSKSVRDHCLGSGGNPFDTVVPDETAGRVSSSHACVQTPRTPEVGIGCDPSVVSGCPGDPSTGLALQNLDVVRVQFLILSRANFTLNQVVDEPGVPGTYIRDVDVSTSQDILLELAGTLFDNRRIANEPPKASFFFQPTKDTVGQPITFDGRNSTDSDGSIIGYSWSFGDGTTTAGAVVFHVYNSPGTFPVSLTVVDSDNALDREEQFITVNPSENQPPVAYFVPSTPKAMVGQPVTFVGNFSYDFDGLIVSYSWAFGDGGNATGPTVTHTYASTGTYTVTLTVTDDDGATGTYSQPIMVNPAVNYRPGVRVGDYARYSVSGNGTGIPDILALSFNVTQVVGTNVTLVATILFTNGTSNSTEQTMDIRSFYSSGLVLTSANLMPGDQIWVDAPYKVNSTVVGFFAGADRLTNLLTISQFGGGFTSQWDQASGVLVYYLASSGDPNVFYRIMIVETNIWGPGPGPNQPPTADFSFAPPKANVGQTVTFDGRNSSDTDGVVVRYHWDFGDGPGLSFNASVVSHTYGSPGNYTVTLTVTDDDGATDTETRVIIVNPVVQKSPPVAIFFFEPQNPIVGQTLRFDAGSSFDPDGFIQSYRWNLGDGTTLFGGPVIFYSYSSPGTFTVTLMVTDNQGLTSSTSAVVAIRARPQHDVGIDFAYLSPTDRLVAGQLAAVAVIVVNRGTSDENVTVAAFHDGVPIGSVTTLIHGSQFYPNYAYVQIFWDTSTASPGDYVITASAHIPLDEDPSNDMFTDGLVTILPPPSLTLSTDRASVGTKVALTGDGFPEAPFPQGFPRPILVSFDNQFTGYVFTMGDGFQFTFNIPHAEPGLHTVNVLDVVAFLRVNTSIIVVDTNAVELGLDVGDLYFEGDTALATLMVLRKGQRIDPMTIQAILTLPDGSTLTLDVRKVQGTTGLYRIEISIPSRDSVGTYTINVDATYQTDFVSSEGHAVNVFTVKTVWLSSRRIQTMSIGGSAAAGIIVALAIAIRTGHLSQRRKNGPTKEGDYVTQTSNPINEDPSK